MAAPPCRARPAAERAVGPRRGERARAAAARRRARRPCRRRSPSRAAAPRRSRRRASPRAPRVSGTSGLGRHRRRAAARPARSCRSSESGRLGSIVRAEHRGERERRSARGRRGRAERRAQRVERLLARPGVDGGERPVRREHLAHPDPHAEPAQRRGELPATTRLTAAQASCRTPFVAHALDVLAHLQRDAQRRVEVVLGTEREQRPRPGDRLPDARQLVELLGAQPRDRGADPRDDRLGHAGQPGADDLGLALARRVVDPVVQAAALERVVQLARAVRRQHHERPPQRRRPSPARGS